MTAVLALWTAQEKSNGFFLWIAGYIWFSNIENGDIKKIGNIKNGNIEVNFRKRVFL